MFKNIYRLSKFFAFLLFCSACASTISFKEYAFAEAAFSASARVSAQKLNPHSYMKAQSYLRKGQQEFKQANYDKARAYFNKAQEFAETAELLSYIKRSQAGGDTLY